MTKYFALSLVTLNAISSAYVTIPLSVSRSCDGRGLLRSRKTRCASLVYNAATTSLQDRQAVRDRTQVWTDLALAEVESKVGRTSTCDESTPQPYGDNGEMSLDVRIHGQWYDLSGWRKSHPAGGHWIDWYNGRDATEVMDAFHSAKGRKMYKRLPKSKPSETQLLKTITAADTPTQLAFRDLRSSLEKDGWWERDMAREYTLLAIWSSLVVGAIVTAHSIPGISIVLTALTFTNGGWLGHDYVHGVDKFADRMRLFAAYSCGLSPIWWSDKHNKHHALTNEIGVDEDIATDPFLYTWAPDPKHDSPLRRMQHWIFWIPFSALFVLWRVDSFKVVVDEMKIGRDGVEKELWALVLHYFAVLILLPFNVWIPAVLFSGFLSALIVTPTHQSEELFDQYQTDWVTAQFRSTRNAVMTNPFSEWLWGGMQYQLEHHLFPSMPRSKYPLLKSVLQKFANENEISGGYKESGEFEILKMNWDLYRKIAGAEPVVGAPYSRGDGQLGSIQLKVSTSSTRRGHFAKGRPTKI